MRVQKVRFSHIIQKKFARSSEVLNIIAFLNNQAEEDNTRDQLIDDICLLQGVCCELQDGQEKMTFILEQLELLQKHSCQRRYSSFLLANAVMWQKTSPALYNQLLNEQVLTLPIVSHLKRLSQCIDSGNRTFPEHDSVSQDSHS